MVGIDRMCIDSHGEDTGYKNRFRRFLWSYFGFDVIGGDNVRGQLHV